MNKDYIILAQSTLTKSVEILLSDKLNMKFENVNDFVKKAESLTDALMRKQIDLANKHSK